MFTSSLKLLIEDLQDLRLFWRKCISKQNNFLLWFVSLSCYETKNYNRFVLRMVPTALSHFRPYYAIMQK